MYGWGSNINGELGDGTTTSRNTPTQIGTGGWYVVSSKLDSAMAIKGGDLYGWGDTEYFTLGEGDIIIGDTPTLVSEFGWKHVSMGWKYGAGLRMK